MLVRLRVDGFKNLVGFDAQFGALTCIAGQNGVGKSNIFDAIDFLRRLADESLLDAAMGVRSAEGKGDPRRLFHFNGREHVDEMRFEVEMLVPPKGVDDLGQEVEASTTFLRYELVIGWRALQGPDERGGLVIRKEELKHITKGDAAKHLHFPHRKSLWRDTAVTGKGNGHRTAPFISTSIEDHRRIVQLHQDGQGRPRPFVLDTLPRTLLSTATAADGPTVALARMEMRSWVQLHLEPSAMRAPSEFRGSAVMRSNGERLAAALYRLATNGQNEFGVSLADTRICSAMANRLSELIDDVRRVWVQLDEVRQVLTLMVGQRGGAAFPASSLSDGTLRFLAMALIEQDPSYGGVICLEEPENGLHPVRIPAMLDLLYSIAVDPDDAIGDENPSRQVIFNTHSPSIVQNVRAQDLVLAVQQNQSISNDGFRSVLRLYCLEGSWREKEAGGLAAPPGLPGDYLLPVRRSRSRANEHELVSDQLRLFDPAA